MQVGAGLLSFPYAYEQSGTVLSSVLCLICAILSGISNYVIFYFANVIHERTGSPSKSHAEEEDSADATLDADELEHDSLTAPLTVDAVDDAHEVDLISSIPDPASKKAAMSRQHQQGLRKRIDDRELQDQASPPPSVRDGVSNDGLSSGSNAKPASNGLHGALRIKVIPSAGSTTQAAEPGASITSSALASDSAAPIGSAVVTVKGPRAHIDPHTYEELILAVVVRRVVCMQSLVHSDAGAFVKEYSRRALILRVCCVVPSG